MPIEFHCPHCEKFLRTPDDKAGVNAKCPGCGEPITIPHRSSSPSSPDPDVLGGYGVQREVEAQRTAQTGRTATRPCPMCGETIDAAAIRCRFCGEALQPGLAPTPSRVHAHEYAGFWLRLVASILDAFILGIPMLMVFGVFVGIIMAAGGPNNPDFDELMPVIQFISNIASLGIGWLYFALMESSAYQGTFGKVALGLQVTDMDGNRIGFGQASGRYFGKIISNCVCYAGYIMAGFTEKKQALHDMMASCLVVKKSSDYPRGGP